MPVISQLYYYPIKSFRGVQTPDMRLDKEGPRHDRQWMLTDKEGSFLSQRQHPELAKIGVAIDEDVAIELSLHEFGTIDFGLEEIEGDEKEVTVFKSKLPAREVSQEVSAWLSEVLRKEVKLMRLSAGANRTFSEDFPERTVRFVDSSPLLMISKASLKFLEKQANVSLSISRFRPNIVIDSGSSMGKDGRYHPNPELEPHIEDTWDQVEIGSVKLKGLRPCSRCKVTTVHPLTGEVGEEPLKTLSTYRKENGKVYFGYYFAHLNEGTLREGQPLKII